VLRVHVEVHAAHAARRVHRGPECLGTEAPTPEEREEALTRHAEPGAMREGLLGRRLGRSAPPPALPGVVATVLDDGREVLAHRHHALGNLRGRSALVVGGGRGGRRPRTQADATIFEDGDRRGPRLRREIDAAIRHHPELAVKGLETAVEARDEPRERARVARNESGARLPRRALRFAGAHRDVELNLSRVPGRHEHPRVAPLVVRPHERLVEGGRRMRPALDERRVVDGDPLALPA
jgi:hypothetical protein